MNIFAPESRTRLHSRIRIDIIPFADGSTYLSPVLQQEAMQLGSRIRDVRGLIQLLLADADARKVWTEATHGWDDGEVDGTRLEFR